MKNEEGAVTCPVASEENTDTANVIIEPFHNLIEPIGIETTFNNDDFLNFLSCFESSTGLPDILSKGSDHMEDFRELYFSQNTVDFDEINVSQEIALDDALDLLLWKYTYFMNQFDFDLWRLIAGYKYPKNGEISQRMRNIYINKYMVLYTTYHLRDAF